MTIFHQKSLIPLLPFGILLALLKPSLARADVLPPGESPVSYCFEINNISKHSDYLFVAHIKSQNPTLPQSNRIIKPGECLELNGYRLYGQVFAVKKSDIDVNKDIITNPSGEAFKDFEGKKNNFIAAENSIYPPRTMRDIYQVEKVADTLEVANINDKYLSLKSKSVTYTYKNGESETKDYINQKKAPEPSIKNTTFLWYIPILGISLIGGTAYWKKFNKSKQAG